MARLPPWLQVKEMVGGIEAWEAEGHPVERGAWALRPTPRVAGARPLITDGAVLVMETRP